jgi:tRNA (cmo5U34)-methyltransferase
LQLAGYKSCYARQSAEGLVRAWHGDIREVELGQKQFDLAISGTALHHLRAEQEWEEVFQKIFDSLNPDGSLWISDFISHEHPAIQKFMYERYGQYLELQGGPEFRDRLFSIIEREDTPRSIEYQMQLLQKIGFVNVTVLHKNACFAAFGGMKVS